MLKQRWRAGQKTQGRVTKEKTWGRTKNTQARTTAGRTDHEPTALNNELCGTGVMRSSRLHLYRARCANSSMPQAVMGLQQDELRRYDEERGNKLYLACVELPAHDSLLIGKPPLFDYLCAGDSNLSVKSQCKTHVHMEERLKHITATL